MREIKKGAAVGLDKKNQGCWLSEVATASNIKGIIVNLILSEQLSCSNCLLIINQLKHIVPG